MTSSPGLSRAAGPEGDAPSPGGTSTSLAIRWNLGVGLLLIVGNLLIVPLGISVAGASPYGVWAICFGLISLLSQADLGLGSALVRQLAFFRARGDVVGESETASAGLRIFGFLCAGMVPLLALGLAGYFWVSSEKVDGWRVFILAMLSCAGLVATLLGRFYVSVAQSHGLYHPDRIAALLGLLVRFAVTLWGALSFHAYFVVPVADVLATVVSLACIFLFVRSRRLMLSPSRRRPGARGSHAADLLRFSLPTFVSSLATLIAIQSPLYFVGATLGFRDAAAFSAITRVFQSARTMIGWVTAPSLPKVARSIGDDTRGQIRGEHAHAILLVLCITAPLTALLVTCGDLVLTLWLGSTFNVYGPVLSLVGVSVLMHGLYAPGVILATGAGFPGVVARNNVILCISAIAFSALLPQVFGVLGGGLAVLVPIVAIFPFSQRATCRITGLSVVRPVIVTATFVLGLIAAGWVARAACDYAGAAAQVKLAVVLGAVGVTWGAALVGSKGRARDFCTQGSV